MSSNFVPEITVEDLAANLNSKDPFILLDIRENWGQELVTIIDDRLVILPMSRLVRDGIKVPSESVKSHITKILYYAIMVSEVLP